MTTDADIGPLLAGVKAAGAKIIVVGDYHQLDSIGPGGALEALTRRHPEAVWTLTDNLRQQNPAERQALEQLRSGSVADAVHWYAGNGRIHPSPNHKQAIRDTIQAWLADIGEGRDSLLLAYRRDNVDALNTVARYAWHHLGQLHGPELHTTDGRVFRAGDRIITLTPGPDRAWTTSQPATITEVRPQLGSVTAITPEGQHLHIGPDYLGPERVGYGYAITAHRSQGATVDTAHVLADGGGRELAYVAMSRARHQSHIHLVTPNPAQAADRLQWAWEDQRRQVWTLQPNLDRLSTTDLYSQRAQLARSIPPDRTKELDRSIADRSRAARDLDDLYKGAGRWEHHPAGHAARALHDAPQSAPPRRRPARQPRPRLVGPAQGGTPTRRSRPALRPGGAVLASNSRADRRAAGGSTP